MSNDDLSWCSYVALVVFAVTLIVAIRPVIVKIPLPASSQPVAVPFNCATAPPLAVAFLLATTCCRPVDAWHGVVGSDENPLEPYLIVVLFFSLAYICLSIDASGLLRYVSASAVRSTRSTRTVSLTFYALASALTVCTSNDIVVLTLTPLICYVCHALDLSPVPHLVLQFHAANTWSTLLYIGNPTNIIASETFGVTFLQYSAWMTIPATVVSAATFAADWLLLPGARSPVSSEMPAQTVTPQSITQQADSDRHDDQRPAHVGHGVARLGPDGLQRSGSAAAQPTSIELVTSHAAAPSAPPPSPLPCSVTDAAQSGAPAETQGTARQGRVLEGYVVRDSGGALWSSVCLVLCTGALIASSLLPIPVWLATLPFACAAFARDLSHDIRASVAREARSARRLREGTVAAVLTRMPWVIIPFVLGTFILVEVLFATGWVPILGTSVVDIAALGSLASVYLVGFLSLAAVALGNNQPMTILISRILLDAFQKQRDAAGAAPDAPLRPTQYGMVFALVLASNLGALVTLNGALAGLMWSQMLSQADVDLSHRKFASVGFRTAVPAFAIALLALWAQVMLA